MSESVSVDDVSPVKITRENSIECLTRAYDLLAAALPLAMEQLHTGDISVSDQRAFWKGFLDLEEWLESVEPLYGELMAGYVEDGPVHSTFYDLAAAIRQREGE